MKLFSNICLVLFTLLMTLKLDAKPDKVEVTQENDKMLQFTKIHKLIDSSTPDSYVVTDNGTWLFKNNTLTQIGHEQPIDVDALPYIELLQSAHKDQRNIWQRLVGLSYIFFAIGFVAVYLYYQASVNKRHRSYYERIKVKQQILNLASLATRDEVLDCDLTKNTINRINKNASIGLTSDIYFQSEEFIRSLHPDDKSIFLGHFESLIHGAKNNYEINYRISDGQDSWIWLVERGCVIERDESGKAKRLVASMRDISSIKQEHENLIRVIDELKRRLKNAESALINS